MSFIPKGTAIPLSVIFISLLCIGTIYANETLDATVRNAIAETISVAAIGQKEENA